MEPAISGHTAREHVRRVQQQLGVHSRGKPQALTHATQYDPWVVVADAARPDRAEEREAADRARGMKPPPARA